MYIEYVPRPLRSFYVSLYNTVQGIDIIICFVNEKMGLKRD